MQGYHDKLYQILCLCDHCIICYTIKVFTTCEQFCPLLYILYGISIFINSYISSTVISFILSTYIIEPVLKYVIQDMSSSKSSNILPHRTFSISPFLFLTSITVHWLPL